MNVYKRYFDKTKCLYFMIKDKTFFDQYMKIWEKVSNIIKNIFDIELIYNKKYLKAEKNVTQKKAFNVIPVIFIYQ